MTFIRTMNGRCLFDDTFRLSDDDDYHDMTTTLQRFSKHSEIFTTTSTFGGTFPFSAASKLDIPPGRHL